MRVRQDGDQRPFLSEQSYKSQCGLCKFLPQGRMNSLTTAEPQHVVAERCQRGKKNILTSRLMAPIQ